MIVQFLMFPIACMLIMRTVSMHNSAARQGRAIVPAVTVNPADVMTEHGDVPSALQEAKRHESLILYGRKTLAAEEATWLLYKAVITIQCCCIYLQRDKSSTGEVYSCLYIYEALKRNAFREVIYKHAINRQRLYPCLIYISAYI